MRPQARNNSHIISKILDQTPEFTVDKHLLKQIILNLVSNAIKYAKEGTAIYMVAGPTKTGRLMIEITNFGKGMTADQIDMAIKPFARLAQSGEIQGTGLGLSLAKQLTEVSGGHFFLNSTVNDRTRARIIYEL